MLWALCPTLPASPPGRLGSARVSTASVLVLGGTIEARTLAARLAAGDTPVIYSLAGRTTQPVEPEGCTVRYGGFGATPGLFTYLRTQNIAVVIDATHPFARTMPHHAARACAQAGVPRLRLLRPDWPRQAGDRWHDVADIGEAAAMTARLLPTGGRVLLTLGQMAVDAFAALTCVELTIRSVEPPARLPQGADWLAARGPFRAESERTLLKSRRIDLLVTKASGGRATYGKIEAARALGLPVIRLVRPLQPDGETLPTVEAAGVWVEQMR